jgi:uncharacterized membrane protein
LEAVNFLTNWINYLFILIPVGAGAAITYFSVRKSLSTDMEEMGHYDVRIKQTIRGAIVGITLSGLIAIMKTFYM